MKRFALCMVITVLALSALYAQAGQTRFVNNTPFTAHIVAGSGRAEVCTLAPHSTGMGRAGFGQMEYFYPVFEVPLTAGFRLRDVRPADPNFFYQIDDRRGSATVVIDTVPPLGDRATYIVLANTGKTGGISVARTASSRLTRIDGGGDNVNAGERGVFRINPRDDNAMRVASPVNVMFPSIVYHPGYRYVFSFDGTEAVLVDARPLHTIGLPLPAAVVFDDEVPEAERDALRAALDEGLAAHNAPLRVLQEEKQDAGQNTGQNTLMSDDGLAAPQDVPEAGETDDIGEIDGTDEARNTDSTDESGEIHYAFWVALAVTKKVVTFPVNREMHSGEVTVTLTRNGPGNGNGRGDSRVIMERATSVTELNEAGLYRAVRQFLTGDRHIYEEIGELDK